MKILMRILIILLAAGLVVGATYAITQIPAVQSSLASQGSEHHGPPVARSDAAATATSTQVRPQRGEGVQSGGNLAGLGEVVKTPVVVLVVSLAIAAAGGVAKRVRPQRRARTAVA